MIALFTISGLGILALLAEIFKFRKLLTVIIPVGVLAAYCLNFYEWQHPVKIESFGNMLEFGKLVLPFSGVILSIAFFWFIYANDYFTEESSSADHYALVCFALTGALMMISYTNMVMLFLGIEILSIPLYVMAASRKKDIASNEAGFKYFLMGAFMSGFLLFGIALVYGATGTFDLVQMREVIAGGNLPSFFYVGVLMMMVAMSFKVSAAPFHFWSPDVYQGSPTVITAFMSTIVKTAAMVAFIRLFANFAAVSDTWVTILSVISAASLVIANITAASQHNVKRMLAYSSISHAGFMLMGIMVSQELAGWSSILYYTLAYSVGSIAAFTVLYNVSKGHEGNENFELFNGLGKRNPLAAVCMVIALFSLAGIPVTAGFFAKYYVLTALMGKGFGWLIVLGILTSAVGVYYYFKIIIAMYFRKPATEEPVKFESAHTVLLIITTLFTLALGFLPGYVLRMLS